MQRATGEKPVLWGASIIGFGAYPYQGASSSGTWPLIGFGPQTKTLSIYIMPGFDDVADLLARLGPHTHGKSCLYVKSLERVDRPTLQTLIERTVVEMRRRTNNGTTPFVHGQSEYTTSAVKARRDAQTTTKTATTKTATTKTPAKKTAAKKTAATTKATTKKATTKTATTKTAAKKTAAKKTAAKKTAATTKATTKKATTKTATTKTAAKKTAAKKTAAKKTATTKTATTKTAAKKTAAKKAATKKA
jgi:hypothetical protein